MLHTLNFPVQPGPVSFDQLTEADRATLRSLARNAHTVVEVGTFIGGSAETLLEAMPEDGELFTIDSYAGTEGSATHRLPSKTMLRYAVERLKPRFGDRVTILVGESLEMAEKCDKHSADLVFIDAAHDYENCKADIDAWLPVVKPGGIFAGHDYDRMAARDVTPQEIFERSHLEFDDELGIHCGVMRAVLESFPEFKMNSNKDSSVWWINV